MALFRNFSKRLCMKYLKSKSDSVSIYENNIACCRMLSYHSKEYENDKLDPAPLFFRQDIQTLLKSLTRADINRIFRRRQSGEKHLEDPIYKFLTDEELRDAMQMSKQKADELLQIPPVLKVRNERDTILSRDPALNGLDTSRIVFTDISFGIKDSERIVVIREPDGTLKEAEWTVKDRMNQIYFPKPHRQLKTPKMFQTEYLESLLNRKEYEYILDRACLQFEPDDREYQRIVSITYQHLNDSSEFNTLRSTRHFGSLVFFLVWNKNIDNLLLDMIETAHVNETRDLLALYGIVNSVKFESDNNLDMIREYIKKCANKRGALELAVQAYCELAKEKEELDKAIKTAHGIS